MGSGGGGGVNNPGVGLFAFIVLFDYNVTIFRGYVFKIVKVRTSHEQNFLLSVPTTHGVVVRAVPTPALELCELGFGCRDGESLSQQISFNSRTP